MTAYGYVVAIYNMVKAIFSNLKTIVTQLAFIKIQQAALSDLITENAKHQNDILNKILAAVTPGPTARVRVTIILDGQIIEQNGDTMQVELTDTQEFDIVLTPDDAKGAASSIDPTKTVLQVSDPATGGTVTVNADGLGGTFKAGTPGTLQITGSVTDANDPTDVVPITPIDVVVRSGKTATVGASVGPVREQS